MKPDTGLQDKIILVTGGAGFIGSHLVRRLLNLGSRVIVADNYSSGTRQNLPVHDSLQILEVDLTSPEAVSILTRSCMEIDAIVHLAANASVTESIREPRKTHIANGAMSLNLFEWAGKSCVSRVIYASSAAVYGDPLRLPVRETDLPRPMSPYAIDKLASEGYLVFFAKQFGFRAYPLRFMNVYGLRQSPAYAGVLTRFLESLQRGENPVIFGDGSQTRDFIHVSDVVDSIVAALTSNEGLLSPANIGTGKPTSLNYVLQVLKQWFDFEPVFLSFREGEIRDSYAEVSLAKVRLQWEARIPFTEGLASLISIEHPSVKKRIRIGAELN